MRSFTRHMLAAGAAAAIALGATAAGADVKTGVDAWMAGKYDASVAERRPPAAQGDADAQVNVGPAYYRRPGVSGDRKHP